MADKITNFSDYKKKDNSGIKDIQEDKPKDLYATTEINNIEIEDPYSFFTAKEREEFLREQAKKESVKEEPKETEPAKEREVNKRGIKDRQEDYDEEDFEEDDDYEDEYDEEEDEEDEEEESSGFLTPEFLVRVASIITGAFILAMLVFVVKVKFIDKYLIDPDSQETVVTAVPSGYTATNDTVTATADLNLRSVPSAAEKSTVVAVALNGTTMKRIAVSDDGSWALVEYEGQQLYASMKYLSLQSSP